VKQPLAHRNIMKLESSLTGGALIAMRKARKSEKSEHIAKLVVELLIPGATMARVDSQANGEHDYNLTYAGGLTVPVEVTQSADFQLECTVGAMGSDHFVTRNASHHDWYVHPLIGARIKDIRAKVDQYLAAIEPEIEREKLTGFFAFRDASLFPGVRKIFEDLKIEAGTIAVWKPPGRIGIAQPSQNVLSPTDSFSAVQRAVEREVLKKRRKKFVSLDAPERHLFVYVDPRNYPAWVALLGSNIPAGQLALSDWGGITDVWVTGQDRSQDAYIVWRCTSGQAWQNLGRVTI